MILLLSFLVCAKLLYCYIAVYNSPYLLQEVFELANHYFFLRGRGGTPPLSGGPCINCVVCLDIDQVQLAQSGLTTL